jgi:Anti-sigma factor NepR
LRALAAPTDAIQTGTKQRRFGFPAEPGNLQSCTNSGNASLDLYSRFGLERYQAVAPRKEICMRRDWTRARGDERLSAKKQGETDDRGAKRARKPSPDKGVRKQRSTDLGRALRTIYDDTLREAVPDDFLNLIGKLS